MRILWVPNDARPATQFEWNERWCFPKHCKQLGHTESCAHCWPVEIAFFGFSKHATRMCRQTERFLSPAYCLEGHLVRMLKTALDIRVGWCSAYAARFKIVWITPRTTRNFVSNVPLPLPGVEFKKKLFLSYRFLYARSSRAPGEKKLTPGPPGKKKLGAARPPGPISFPCGPQG